MVILRILDILNITLAALVMGVFWGPWLALTRSMSTLAPDVFLDAAASEIRAKRQVNVRTIAADLSSDAAVRKVAGEAGDLDILVNNAGAIPPGDVLSVDDEREVRLARVRSRD